MVIRPNLEVQNMKSKAAIVLIMLMAIFAVIMAGAVSVAADTPVEAVNTTGITEMADTIVALLIALIPILLILGIWARMKGIFVVIPFTVLAVNTTGITEMADTIVALLIALIPILLILGIWARMKGVV